MSDRSGKTLGHYRLETIIGHGSMADVYRATILGLDDTVAVKVIHPHLLEQPNLLERFKREAEAMASLRHPNIVHLFDFVYRDDIAYIVMEYLGGGTLEQRLTLAREAGNRLAPALVARWMTAIAGAVDLAHSHGLVHRDLKPANILFRETGEPVLTDFGLAFLMDQSRLSPSNSMTGTPVYLSPEQARGMPGDSRSDIYSLGVILYEILVGQTPFQGPTISVAMKHITEAPPSPRQLGRYLPPEVEGVIMRALAKSPVERYQSAGALAQALDTAVRQRERDAHSPEPVQPPGGSAQPAAPSRAGRDPIAKAAVSRAVTAAAPQSRMAPGSPPANRHSAPEPARQALAARPEVRPHSAGPRLRQGLTALVVMAGLAAFAAWSVAAGSETLQPPAAAPLFAVGAQVAVVVPGAGSTSVLRGCPAGFWLGVLGLATDGDGAQVTARQLCGNQWWYQVELPGDQTSAWDGVGWINGANLAPR